MQSALGTVETEFFTFADAGDPFELYNGGSLSPVTLAYEAYGELNEAKDNAILIFHALTGSHHAAGINPKVPDVGDRWTEECQMGWWDGFIGPAKAFDTDNFCVICINYVGGCYGSTGPASISPETGKPYASSFPQIAFRDIVDSQLRLLDHLGVEKLHGVSGASTGGLLCMNLSIRFPDRVKTVIPIATSIRATPLQRIYNLEQIFAIERDPNFRGGEYYGGPPPSDGLALARMISHKTFISTNALPERARHEVVQPEDKFSWYRLNHPIESYFLHQGKKLVDRFDANTYLRIVDAWSRFDLLSEMGKESYLELFAGCREQQYLIFSIDSDFCFYPEEQEKLNAILKEAQVSSMHITVHSEKGHDSFLLEPELFAPNLEYFLKRR